VRLPAGGTVAQARNCVSPILIGIDEGQVEWCVGAECWEQIERCAHADIGPVGQSCVCQVFPRDLGVSLIDLQRDQVPVGRQCARKVDRTVSAQRADLQHALRAGHPREQRQQPSVLRRHLDGRHVGGRGGFACGAQGVVLGVQHAVEHLVKGFGVRLAHARSRGTLGHAFLLCQAAAGWQG
jgi:hypothetical protein